MNYIAIAVGLLVGWWLFSDVVEGWASSPATLIQLSASSGYYPMWRYGWGYRWPFYRYVWPYYAYQPSYVGAYGNNLWPAPSGYYNYY